MEIFVACSSEEHLKDLGGVGPSHSWHALPVEAELDVRVRVGPCPEISSSLIPFILNVPTVVALPLLGIGQDRVCFSDVLEFLSSLLLLNLALGPVAVRVMLEGESLVGLLDLSFSGSPRNAQNGIVVFLLRSLLLPPSLLDPGLEVGRGIQLLGSHVVVERSRVVFALHVDVCPSQQRFHVVWLQLERLIQVLQGLDAFSQLAEGEASIGVNHRVELLIVGVQGYSLTIARNCFFPLLLTS